MIATKRSPCPPVCSQKYLKWLSVSTVPPDLLDTTKSVWSRSTALSASRTAAGCGAVEDVELAGPSVVARKLRRKTSGARLDPPMPSSSTCGHARAADLGGELLQVLELVLHVVGDRQPAEAVGELGRARVAAPQRRVLLPDAARDVLVAGALDALADGLLERRRAGWTRRSAGGG